MWARATLLWALLLAGRWACAGPAGPLRVAFEDFNMQTLTERADKTSTLTEQNVAETESVVMSPDGGYSVTSQRMSDLKYVTAIQRSTVWSEIKKRSVTVSGGGGGGGGVLDKSPETLSDAELAQLKRLCHDGLKCMAVEQLYVIKTVKRQIVGGDEDGTTAAVRTVITKITKVITNYTTEYHKDTYEYAEVTESSDPSAVYESVTNIIEDNRELCGVNADGDDDDDDDGTGAAVLLLATLAGGGGPNDPAAAAGRPNDAAAAGPVSFVNLGTINHYNVNDGTINNVDVTVQQAGGGGGGGGEDSEGTVVIEMEGDDDGAAYPAPFNGQSSLQTPETVYVDAAGAGGDGNVTVNNTNNGTYNSNVMQGNADAAGTVNVGSVNEAPLHNDTYNDYSVDSHDRTVNARDFKKFLEFIDNSFSSVLNELGPPAGQNPTV